MVNVHLFLLLTYILLASSLQENAGNQSFVTEPSDIEVYVNEDVLLPCKVLNKKGICSWQKDKQIVKVLATAGKYQWASENQTKDCSLWIRKVQMVNDNGIWICRVSSNKYNTSDYLISRPAKLLVKNKLPLGYSVILILFGYIVLGVTVVSFYYIALKGKFWYSSNPEILGVSRRNMEIANEVSPNKKCRDENPKCEGHNEIELTGLA